MNADNLQITDGLRLSRVDSFSRNPVAVKRVLLGVIALAALAVFSKTIGAGFLFWDDNINIYDNPHLKLGLSLEGLHWMFADVQYLPRYMPLGWFSLAVNYQIGGLDPVGFHVGNVLFHSVNSALVFLLLHRLLSISQPRLDAGAKPLTLLFCSAFGALLWAVHPLRVEAVAWASARVYQQGLFFLLISFLAYLTAQSDAASPGRQRFLLWISIITFLCSLLTYPLALGYPLVLMVLDAWLLKRAGSTSTARSLWLEKIPFVAAAAFVLALTLAGRAYAHSSATAGPLLPAAFPLSERVMQAFYIWGYYLWKPWLPLHLAPMYPTLISFDPWTAPFLISAFIVLGITAGLWLRRRSCPGLIALWVCYLAVLFPFIGLTEHPHFPSDRYSLIPGVLWSVVISAALLKICPRVQWRPAAVLIGAAVLTVLAALSIRQCDVWQDDAHLFPCIIVSVENHPARAKPDLIYGVLLTRQGRLAEAEQSFRNAIRFQPQYAPAHASLADALSNQDKPIAAIPIYQRALALDPGELHARQGLAVALGATGRFDEAAAEFRTVLRADPNNGTALHNLAITLYQLGQINLSHAYAARAQEILQRATP